MFVPAEELKREKARRLFASDPNLYAKHVLGVNLWAKQQEILQAIVDHRRVMVPASHGVGKSMVMGGAINWHYDCFDPGITISTAPTADQVVDVLWKEVRRQRKGRPGLLPKAPRLESSEDHFAVGLTAAKPDAFQGRHEKNVLIVFDEAVAVDSPFWDAAEGMMTSPERRLVAIFNPTDVSSRAYQEYSSERWHKIHISALEHPNIKVELENREAIKEGRPVSPVPYPGAVSLTWVEEKIEAWCTPLGSSTVPTATDIEWPPDSGTWYRPGPLFESRALGRWPSQSVDSVWSQAAWEACLQELPIPQEPLVIACDVAYKGDDMTAIHARRGGVSIFHESGNGWSFEYTANRLKEVAKMLVQPNEDPKKVLIAIDDDAWGNAVMSHAHGWNFVSYGVSAGARMPENYPNCRSERWFVTSERANRRELSVSRLSEGDRHNLMTQCLAPKWKLDGQGRRVVEPKDDAKKRIKRSPDDADAFNLCHYANPGVEIRMVTL